MSLQGSLRHVGLADLLQGPLAGRRGSFHVRRPGRRAVLHVESHQLRLVEPDCLPAGALLQGLVHRGMLDGAEYREATRAHKPDQVVDFLLAKGRIPREEVDRLLMEATEDAILDLLTWERGEFKFVEGEDVPKNAGLISRAAVNTDAVLLLAAKRADEQAAIERGLGAMTQLYVPTSKQAPKSGFDGDPAEQVHALLDGMRVVDEISMLAGLTRFVTLRAILACVESGAARAATAQEVWNAAVASIGRGETHLACVLLQQWSLTEPENRWRPVETATEQPLRVLRGRLTRHPDDTRTLTALAALASVAGDVDLEYRSVMDLARMALEEEEPERTVELLEPYVADGDAPLSVRVLRGQAFVALQDADGLVAEARAVTGRIGTRCADRAELDAAAFFRDALTAAVPSEVDLVRDLVTSRRLASPLRRLGPIAALALLVATAAVVFWPESAESILDKAQEAAAKGDDTEALQHIADLAERFPDSPETRQAEALQTRLPTLDRGLPALPKQLVMDDEQVQKVLAACVDALPRLPDAEARAGVDALAFLLLAPEASSLRRPILDRMAYDIGRAAERMSVEIRSRADTFERAAELATARDRDEAALRALVETASGWSKDAYAQDAAETAASLERLLQGSLPTAVRKAFRDQERALERLTRGAQAHGAAVDSCRREVARLDLQALHQRCITEGSELLADGSLDEAAACFGALASFIETLRGDPVLKPLLDEVEKRGMQRLLDLRGGTLAEIQRSLESAAAMEQAGDLDAAIEAYATLARRFGSIHFENVIPLPVRVQTVPGGATVEVNGKAVGKAPQVVHYPWNTRVELTAATPGYETVTHVLEVGAKTPPAEVRLELSPRAVWSVDVDAAVSVPPVQAEKDVLVCDRTGRVHLCRGSDGHIVWSSRVEGVQDIRARPLVSGGIVYLPLIDGRVHLLDLYDGRQTGSFKLEGNLCGSAVLGDLVTVVSLQGDLTGFRGRNTAFSSKLGATPSGTVLAAHGVFWIGTDDGAAIRVDPKSKGLRIKLPGRRVPVRGIASHPGGILLAKADGTLHALTPAGKVVWSADAVGDVVGAPAVAAGKAACMDSRGRVVLFDLADGTPQGQIDLGASPRAGFLAVPDVLVTCLKDGRLWIYDPATGAERASVVLDDGVSSFGVAAHGDAHLVASATDGSIRLLVLPAAPSK